MLDTTTLILIYIASVLINRWLMIQMMKLDGEERRDDYDVIFIFWFLPVVTTIVFLISLAIKYITKKNIFITNQIKKGFRKFFLLD